MFKTTALATVVALAMGGSAFAQANSTNAGNNKIDAGGGKGLVVVDISNNDIAQNIANDLSALNDLTVQAQDVIDIGSVQVPISVAAAVCELEVNAIASSNDKGEKSCDAQSTNDALNQAVQQSLPTQSN